MDLSKHYNDLPVELETEGKVEEYKLLKLYAFNAYFNADPIHSEDVNKGCCFVGRTKISMDGIYIDDSSEENTVDCLYTYLVEKDKEFDIAFAERVLENIKNQIDDIRKRVFNKYNEEAESLLDEYISGEEGFKRIVIRIVTNYVPTSLEDKRKIDKRIENYNVSIKGFDVEAYVVYGDDIENVINSNKAPFDWVNEGKLNLDKEDNYLTYDDHSIVCNISAMSLRELWKDEGKRGLLAMNLRYYIKSKNIDEKIEESIIEGYKDFWYMNNGIIIVCNDYEIKNKTIYLKEFSIVNGGQTTRMIGETPFEKDFFVTAKIIKNVFETNNEKNMFISQVAEASNTQKPIKAKDIIANKIEQRNLKSMMSEHNIFVEVKRGDKYDHQKYKEPWQRTKNNELAQDLYAFVYMEPGPARNNVSKILQSDDKYNVIFKNHTYSFEFLRDVLFLEKAFREYQKMVSKMNELECGPTKKGLVKNGLWYCLATIGYILKLQYNPLYLEKIESSRSSEKMYKTLSSELAFNHGFVKSGVSYADFRVKMFTLFNFIFDEYIITQFNMDKDSSPSLVYSNWTKTNSGFDRIRKMIHNSILDYKKFDAVSHVAAAFAKPIESQIEESKKMYADYCEKALASTTTFKAMLGDRELTESEKELYDALLVYRYTKSREKHIQERMIYSDKTAKMMAIRHPETKEDLKEFLSKTTLYYCGEELVKLFAKYPKIGE